MPYSQTKVATIIALTSINSVLSYAGKELSEIMQLRAEPDFRSVNVKWDYPIQGTNFNGFQLHYCELQAWGPNRCRNKIVNESEGLESFAGKNYRTYSTNIGSLRMATNYSINVRPIQTRHNMYAAKELGKTIIVPTKGFSAKANLCLPDVSEVEISTGPYFGGRIAVESLLSPSDNPGSDMLCSVKGDSSSAKDTYILRIEHKHCGSTVNRTAVSTLIMVQETLPILTHSTRRFVVLCTFQPETLTVRAGINMPHHSIVDSANRLTTDGQYKETGSYMMPTPLAEEIIGNDIQAASLKRRDDLDTMQDNFYDHTDTSRPQYILGTVILLVSVFGLSLTIWLRSSIRKKSNDGSKCSASLVYSNDEGISSVYENYTTNSISETVSITEINFGDIINDNLRFSETNK